MSDHWLSLMCNICSHPRRLQVLALLPSLLPAVVQRGEQLRTELDAFAASSGGLFRAQGLGLMRGVLLNQSHPLVAETAGGAAAVMQTLRAACAEHKVLPYFVPVGGFMVTPLYDVQEAVVCEIGARLGAALRDTLAALSESHSPPAEVGSGVEQNGKA